MFSNWLKSLRAGALLLPLFALVAASLVAEPALARPDAKTIDACAAVKWQERALHGAPGFSEIFDKYMNPQDAFGDGEYLRIIAQKGSTVMCKYVATTDACVDIGYNNLKRVLGETHDALGLNAKYDNDAVKDWIDNILVLDFIYATRKTLLGRRVFSETQTDTPGFEGLSDAQVLDLFRMSALAKYIYCNASNSSDKGLKKSLPMIEKLFSRFDFPV